MVGEPVAAVAVAAAAAADFVTAVDALHQSILHGVDSIGWVECGTVATWGGDATVGAVE